jgi:SNF2 family DNA or RNA helicase
MRQISVSLALLQASHSKLGKLHKVDTWKSPRIEKAAQLIEEHQGQSISFCFYRTTLDLLETNLQKRGIKCIVIKSEMKLGLRDFYIDKFVKGKYKAMLITYQCGSLGHNWTNATMVNVLSPHWNIQVIQQAFKRCYRLGQTKPVTVNMFVTENSIESRMMEICTEKEKIEEVLLAEHKNKKKLTVDEIKKLF